MFSSAVPQPIGTSSSRLTAARSGGRDSSDRVFSIVAAEGGSVGPLFAWPLPGRGPLTIAFETGSTSGSVATPAEIALHDAAGRQVRCLARDLYPPGTHVLQWDALDENGQRVRAGVSWLRLRADGGGGRLRIVVIP